MKERASLAGASRWLRLFNALINPLLKAKQRVSGFVLWPRDYSGINKGWAGNIDEIPPPPLGFALWLFSNKAGGRDDMQQEICQHKTMLVRVGMLNEHLKTHVQYTCCACVDRKDPSGKMTANACVIIHPHPLVTTSEWRHRMHWAYKKY